MKKFLKNLNNKDCYLRNFYSNNSSSSMKTTKKIKWIWKNILWKFIITKTHSLYNHIIFINLIIRPKFSKMIREYISNFFLEKYRLQQNIFFGDGSHL